MAGTFPERSTRRIATGGILVFALALALSACQLSSPPGTDVPGAASGAASIRLRSSPSGAVVTLDGRDAEERTPALLSPVEPGEHTVTVSLPRYRGWRKSILLGQGETVNLDVLLQPMATGSLSVSSVPFQNIIFIDGRPTPWLTPATIDNLALGTHTILLKRDGYEDWSQAIVIVENRRLQLKASLKPSRGLRGSLNIQTSPSRAAILLDGYPTGNTTPTTLFNLIAGSHTIQLRKKGFATWSDDVTVMEEATSNLLVTMKPAGRELSGAAEIDSTPPGAAVTLDGVLLRQKTPVVLESIATGSHSLKVGKYGFLAWEGDFRILPDEKTVLSVTLDYRIDGMLDLLVRSSPPGAAVTVDGETTNQVTPATFGDLSPGAHRVRLEKEGFRSWTRPIEVSSNRVTVVQADLVPEGARLELTLKSAGEGEVEFETRLVDAVDSAGAGKSVAFAVSPPYFGLFSPRETLFAGGRARTVLSILSPLEKARVTLSAGDLSSTYLIRKGPAGWEVGPEEKR